MLRIRPITVFVFALLPVVALGANPATPAAAPASGVAHGAAADKPASAPKLSAEVIVERNIAARGGQSAWQAIQTLSCSGKMDAGGNNARYIRIPGMPPPPVNENPSAAQVQLPFTLEMKRGGKTRLELQFNGQSAVQVYDGEHGWKLRPFLNRHQIEPYTADEARIAANEADIGGLLVNHAASATKIEVAGVEAVEGKPAYKLAVTLKSGQIIHDWVDAQSFLEVKMDGTPRRLDGRMRAVQVHMRDYRNIGGVQLPYLIETSVQGVERTERIVIEKATVNPQLDDTRFGKPA